MRNFGTLICIVIIATQNSFGQSIGDFVKTGDSLYKIKAYQKSFEYYKKAIDKGDTSIYEIYNGACSASLAGKKNEAFRWLDLAVNKGLSDVEHLKTDNDFVNLHDTDEWGILISKVQKISDSIDAHLNKPLQKELMEIWANDQNIRDKYLKASDKYGWHSPTADSLRKLMIFDDSIDLTNVAKILDEYGWVGKDKVGNANTALFLVIQHADLKTQEKYLPMIKEAVKSGNAKPYWLALLEDRIALREGKRQIYGSQISRNDSTNKWYVAPLEDPDNVDERRAKVGLVPLAEAVKESGIIWNVEEYKKQLPEIEKHYKY